MRISKLSICLIASASVMAFAPAAYANSTMTSVANGATVNMSVMPRSHEYSTGHKTVKLLDGSTTATKYFYSGLKKFEEGNLEDAENAFKASLRARGLDQQSLHYLVVINDKQGDDAKVAEYAKAYFDLADK